LWCRWRGSEKWKLSAICLNIWRQHVVVNWKNNIRTYLKNFGSDISTRFFWLSKGAPLFQQSDAVSPCYCNSYTEGFTRTWTMQLLSATALIEQCTVSVWLTYEQSAQKNSGVVTSLTGNPLENTHRKNRTNIASVLRVQKPLLILRCSALNWVYVF
jgi:hypothetical protein